MMMMLVDGFCLCCAELPDSPIGRGPGHPVGRLGLLERMFPYLWRRRLILPKTVPQFQVRPSTLTLFTVRTCMKLQ